MKTIFTWLTIFALGMTLVACSAGNQTQLPTGGEESLIKVGNPTIEGPDTPTSKAAMTKKLIADRPNWMGSAVSNEGTRSLYQAQFGEDTVTVYFAGRSVPVELKYTINDDGSIVTEESEGYPVALSGFLREDSKMYPLDLILTDSHDSLDATLFSSEDADFQFLLEWSKVKAATEATEHKVFDIDGDTTFESQYYIAGYVAIKNPTTGEIVRKDDECSEDGATLIEAVALDEAKDNSFAAVKEISCTCVNGACVDEAMDKIFDYKLYISPDLLELFKNSNPFTFTPIPQVYITHPIIVEGRLDSKIDADDLKQDSPTSPKVEY